MAAADVGDFGVDLPASEAEFFTARVQPEVRRAVDQVNAVGRQFRRRSERCKN